jgi:hypothetical protein
MMQTMKPFSWLVRTYASTLVRRELCDLLLEIIRLFLHLVSSYTISC